MPIQKRIQFAGLSRQSAKGTIGASTQYGLPTLRGGILRVDVDDVADEVTSLSRIEPAEIRKGAKAGAAFDVRGYPASLGLLLYAALGNISTSGAGNYTHTITPADLPLYVSLFGRLGAEYSQVRDCMIDELKIAWSKAEPMTISLVLMGTVMTYAISAWTATNDETLSVPLPTAGGTFKVDIDSATAVEAQIVGGEITIKNNIQPVELSKAITPDDVFPGKQEITCDLDIVPATALTDWRAAVLGSDAGTVVNATPVYGSFDELFAIDANTSLQLAATRVPWKVDYPEGDPSGGPVEIKVRGSVRKPAGAALTATVKNQTASYAAV